MVIQNLGTAPGLILWLLIILGWLALLAGVLWAINVLFPARVGRPRRLRPGRKAGRS